MTLWTAPLHPDPVDAVVTVPGSKSITNRALVLAALADAPSSIVGALRSRDTDLMAGALAALGADVRHDGDRTLVTPGALHGADVDCGLAGTVMRFVPPVATLADGDVRFDGDEQARVRPMDTILGALRALGASVDGDRLPFTVHGTGALRGGAVSLDASGSSQFVSGLLLSGARFGDGLTVHHDGPPVPSQPHIDMTVAMLAENGVAVDTSDADIWRVAPGVVRAVDRVVEPDLSNATPFLAAAAVTGGVVRVPRWPVATTQAGDAIRDILAAMGASVTRADDGLVVRGPATLGGIDVDLHDVGELAPTVAAMAAFADGPSTLRGIAHLRGHETDRLDALARELGGIGATVTQTEDGLRIEPGTARASRWASYADHRMATAGAIVGLRVPGVEVEDVETTAKTMPGFVDLWEAMLAPTAGVVPDERQTD